MQYSYTYNEFKASLFLKYAPKAERQTRFRVIGIDVDNNPLISRYPALEYIEKLYSSSSAPTAATDSELNVIWANDAALSRCPSLALRDGIRSVILPEKFNAVLRELGEKKSVTVPVDSFLPTKSSAFLTYLDSSDIVLINFFIPVSDAQDELLDETEKVIASFSSQFRSPLTLTFSALSSVARALSDKGEAFTSPAFDSLRTVNRSCYNILKNCNNIVTLSRYTNSVSALNLKRINASEYFSELFKALRIFTDAIGIPLDVDFGDNITLVCDPQKISLVFINLIANCCKFTRDGNIISASAKKLDNRVVFTVSDRGAGMNEYALSRAFDAFFSYDPTAQYTASAGLGLTISKLILTEHKSALAIESKEGVGTKIVFSLPLDKNSDEPLAMSLGAVDYLSDKFSDVFVQMSEVADCPMP